MAKDKVGKIVTKLVLDSSGISADAKKATDILKKAVQEVQAEATKATAAVEATYKRLGNKAGFFANVAPAFSGGMDSYNARPTDPNVRAAMRGTNRGVKKRKQDAIDLANKELADAMAMGPSFEEKAIYEKKLATQRRKGQAAARRKEKEDRLLRKAYLDQSEPATDAASYGPSSSDIEEERQRRRRVGAKRRLKAYKARKKRESREAAEATSSADTASSEAQSARRTAAVRRLRAYKARKTRMAKEASAQQDAADSLVRADKDRQRKARTARRRADQQRRRMESQRQARMRGITGRAQAGMGFAGAALGSALFATGGSMGGGFANIPGAMVSRGFAGAGIGAMLGMAAGPVGAAAGLVTGGGLGAGIGLLESGIPAVINALRSGLTLLIETASSLAQRLFKAGAEYERQMTKFGILTGSPEAGKKLYGGIESMSTKTPYSMGALSTNAELLLGYGVANDNILPALSRIGDVAGGDATRLERLGLAFGQVMAQGKLAGQELRQFSEAGVGIADFAKTAGMSTFQFRKEMENGLIPANIMVQTINRLTSEGGRFYQMNQKISETAGGQWQMMMGTVDKFERRLGDFFNKRVGAAGIFASITDWIPTAAEKIESFIDKAVGWGERAYQGLVGPFQRTMDMGGGLLEKIFGSGKDGAPDWASVGAGFEDMARRIVMAIAQMVDMANHLKREFQDETMPWNWKIWKYHKYSNPITYAYSQMGSASDIKAIDPNATVSAQQYDTPAQYAVTQAMGMADARSYARTLPPGMGWATSSRSGGKSRTGFGLQGTLDNLGIGGVSAGGTPDIKSERVVDRFSAEITNLAERIGREIKDGISPLEKFANSMQGLNAARYAGPNPDLGSGITKGQYEFGRFQAFQELTKGIDKANEQRLPEGGAEQGSDKAAQIIAGSLEMSLRNEMNHMEILKEQHQTMMEAKDEMAKLNKFFEDNKEGLKMFIEIIEKP